MKIKEAVLVCVAVSGCVGGAEPATASKSQAVSGSIDSVKLPTTFLQNANALHGEGALGDHGHHAQFAHGVPNVDSVVNFTGSFSTPGFDGAGNPQTEWPYSMVGRDPSRNEPTFFRAPVVPISVELLDSTGAVAVYNGTPLRFSAGPDTVDATVRSPVFSPFSYNSGFGQFTDQMMRTQFWDKFPHRPFSDFYHDILLPQVLPARTIQIPFGSWYFFVNAQGVPEATVVDIDQFANQLFPPAPGDTTTVLGSLETNRQIATRDITTLLFKDVYLYAGDISNCCILGFHSYDSEPGDASNGNKERRYVMNFSSYISPNLFGFGFQDVTAFSHEMAELFADPFVDNATPWWLSSDPILGSGLCQNNLETGDVIEVLSTPTYPTAMNDRTYHPSNEALLPWFAMQDHSTAKGGAYSFPDETVLPALSPHPLTVGCQPPTTTTSTTTTAKTP